jgi:triosephosphate isomerase
MIADAGGKLVIVGHSERRTDHGEKDAEVRAKAEAAWRAGLTAIVCIGETESQRRGGETDAVLSRQVAGSVPDGATAANLVVAYEPVWAIGTGLTPSTDDIRAAHAHIRARLAERLGEEADAIRILYGGSVKPGNAAEIMGLPGVDGALVGGASLKAVDFLAIVRACG